MVDTIEVDFLAFDLDGTLVHSAPTIMSAWHEWALAYGISEPSLEVALGGRAADTVHALLPRPEWEDGLNRYLQLEREYIGLSSPTPGALEFLAKIDPEDWGVVTSSEQRNARERLDTLGFPTPRFLVASLDTPFGKPSPDPYLRIVELAQRATGRVAAFEDSLTGITSATQAGLAVVTVTANSGASPLPTRLAVEDFLPEHISIAPVDDGYRIDVPPCS